MWALTVPETVGLLYELRQAGLNVPLDALSVDECAQAIAKALKEPSDEIGGTPLEPIIETQKLTHTYSAGTPFEHKALDAVDFYALPGEIVGIIGHTGSGKSTLIQHLNGLLKPTSGQIFFQGKDIWAEPKKIREIRFQVGLVFQYPEYQLFEETVYKDIAFGPTNMKLDAAEIDRRIHAAADAVNLPEETLRKVAL